MLVAESLFRCRAMIAVTPAQRRRGTFLVGSSAGFSLVPTQTLQTRVLPQML